MKKETTLPFAIGQSVESKYYIPGYRGAWFRSKIKAINYKTGKCLMDYYDYPDNEPEWIDLYKKPPHLKKKSQTKDLMIRPCYPPICNQNENDLTQVAVVISDWRLGDLVDWLHTNCWWSGTIIELFLSEGKAKVEFLGPPLGEGTVEEVLIKDIRPSLNWSLEGGWTVPTQDNGRACAQIIQPLNLVQVPVEVDIQNRVEETEMLTGSSSKPSLLSPLSPSLEQKGVETTTVAQKEYLENTVPTQQAVRTDTRSGSPVKRHGVALNTPAQSDSALAAVWKLEECLMRVKCLKAMLQAGDTVSDDAPVSKWEYAIN